MFIKFFEQFRLIKNMIIIHKKGILQGTAASMFCPTYMKNYDKVLH